MQTINQIHANRITGTDGSISFDLEFMPDGSITLTITAVFLFINFKKTFIIKKAKPQVESV